MLTALNKNYKLTVLGLLVVLVLLITSGCGQQAAEEPVEEQVIGEEQRVDFASHLPGAIRKDVAAAVDYHFPAKTDYKINVASIGSRDLSKDLLAGIEQGTLKYDVILTYGRTGETPPGRDIYAHLNNSRHLMEALPDFYDIRPEFAALVDAEGHLHVPYVGTGVIVYNPELINREDVPKSWAALADFDGQIAIPGRGCYGMRTLASLYHTVGAEKFEQIIINAQMPALEVTKDDPRDVKDKPLSGCGAIGAVIDGKFKVGVGPLVGGDTQQAIADGKLGVIWPEEGAFAFPYLAAVRKDPSEAALALLDFIANDPDVSKVFTDAGLSSTIVGGTVSPIVTENNFNFNFIPIEKLMQKEVHQSIIDIVARNQPEQCTCKQCGSGN
ncbi:ABC transporter substrate-binding protein [Peptococcaceae bacterium]|nr:ABC transporter substrate-binding protein [Peptococcaceae bacterium]